MKQWMHFGLAVFLLAGSLFLNRDWFGSEDIQIYHRSSPRPAQAKRRFDPQASIAPLLFGFDRKLKLTEVKVIPVHVLLTNKYPHPVWHMISESNSMPVKSFGYGGRIPGMHPSIPNAMPDPLVPGQKYRLFISAGHQKLEHDFEPIPPWR